ncbi:hypothetical protein DFH08DRAFT_821972 [Mycena albidolilacea]|uniref:Uncharacterized protein n=1 Tax=Mycena albidolilacea TaxID=1033008 RepID=A0AAD7ECN0_9AGAR|nr:hypothetical protein DFH08DRAFT_821972 [Mycena albidolilacea]
MSTHSKVLKPSVTDPGPPKVYKPVWKYKSDKISLDHLVAHGGPGTPQQVCSRCASDEEPRAAGHPPRLQAELVDCNHGAKKTKTTDMCSLTRGTILWSQIFNKYIQKRVYYLFGKKYSDHIKKSSQIHISFSAEYFALPKKEIPTLHVTTLASFLPRLKHVLSLSTTSHMPTKRGRSKAQNLGTFALKRKGDTVQQSDEDQPSKRSRNASPNGSSIHSDNQENPDPDSLNNLDLDSETDDDDDDDDDDAERTTRSASQH